MSEMWNCVRYGAFSPRREVAMLMAPLANCLQTAVLKLDVNINNHYGTYSCCLDTFPERRVG
jgi:hypothetical protein